MCLDNLLTGRRCAVPALDGPPLEFQFCDVTEPFDVAGPVDLVLHLASPASPADYKRYPLDGSQTRSLCHVNDTVRGLLLLAAGDFRGTVKRVRWQEGLIETIDWFRRLLAEQTLPPREQGPAADWLASERAAGLSVR